jgi:hypothetical protein
MMHEWFMALVVWTGIITLLTMVLLGLGGIWKMEMLLARRLAIWKPSIPPHAMLQWSLVTVPVFAMLFSAWCMYAGTGTWKAFLAHMLVLGFTIPWNGALISGWKLRAR